MHHKSILAGVFGASLALALTPTAVSAGSLTFYVQSNHKNVVSLEFYSQNRDHVWPGNSKVYIIEDYDTHSYALSCRSGEKICYGAWVRNSTSEYWGVGYNNREYCESCCWTCNGGETPVIHLNY